MGTFLRAVVYGFGFSLGAALYKRASDHWGFEDPKNETDAGTSESSDEAEAEPASA